MKKERLYNIEEYHCLDIISLYSNINAHAKAINGLPQNHSEVFNKRGWMLPFLFSYDTLLWKRWDYWFEIIEKGTIDGSGPIPQIKWANTGSNEVQETSKMLQHCLNHYEANIDNFADWLIWGLSINKETNINHISQNLNEHYYRAFDLFLVLKYPTDYLSHILTEETGKGYKSGLGYYPTPFSISEMMVKMSFSDDKSYKTETVNDPCIGCGAMLLPASNYTLRGYGQDISKIAISLATIQMYWYAPWYAFHPNNLKGFNDFKDIIMINSNNKKQKEGQYAFNL
ncbi:N-6 DNA methylase [Virgibacillus salexigens]|uniref:Type I restriction-modification system methyltransferase subunit n=1 Tax=Virgibacillus massiliensis TaxID=1462526 RepID=A0A024QI31_9BACI|nr:N-6 DNA methylase [Virgibacillus massiliensis]CDQ41892.1 Type I restriction-modification system methyltransferase subunit [Virgibacillus massiliensis]